MKSNKYIHGMSFKNCVCFIEESQNFSKDEIETVLTRLKKETISIFIKNNNQKQYDLHKLS
jgi:predicted ribonuclease YlaK